MSFRLGPPGSLPHAPFPQRTGGQVVREGAQSAGRGGMVGGSAPGRPGNFTGQFQGFPDGPRVSLVNGSRAGEPGACANAGAAVATEAAGGAFAFYSNGQKFHPGAPSSLEERGSGAG